MATKNPAAASAILGLMFASLLVIYVVVPQNDLVTFLSVVIMAIGLVIAFLGERDEIMMMAGLAGIISLIAAYFAGQTVFGTAGSVLATVGWGVALFVMARRASNETVVIPEDHAFMVAPFLSSQAYAISSSIPLTSLPFLDRHVATIPTYELTRDVDVKKVNTRAGDDVELIQVHARYQVTDPSQTLRGIPNRGRIQSEIAREMGTSVSRARLDVAFWEKLLERQMEAEVDDIVRKVMFKAGAANNMLEAYNERDALSQAVLRDLQELVGRWGVTVDEIALDFYVVNEEKFRRIKGGMEAIERELDRDRRKRRSESESEAERIRVTGTAQAEMIRKLIEQVKETDPDLDSADITEIVRAALLAAPVEEETELERMLVASRGAPQKR